MILKSIFYLNSTRRLRQVKTKPTILASLPSRASVLSNTVITVGLVGIGDFLAQVFLNLDHVKRFDYRSFLSNYDFIRTFHMAISSAFMGPWFAWWYPYLAANYASIWTRLGLELLTAQFLHVGFLMCYYIQHFGSLPSWNKFVNLAIELVQVDLLIFSPIALINFKFIPVGIWQTVFVNTGYVTVVEPVGSLRMTDFESSFGKFTKSHFSNILVLFTIGTEQLTSLLAFECPCNPEYKMLYGLSYLLGPALIVFLLALSNQPLFWMVTTGCCYRRNDCFGESKSSPGKVFTTVLKSINNALPAAMVWVIITLLKGDAYACAFWPYSSDLEPSVQVCRINETVLLPCQIPVTTGKNEFNTCNEQLARNLRAESHMIAFVYIALAGFFAFFGYVLHQCNGPYSYYQKSWIDSYTTTEHNVMQHKIQLRANDLASELANEFLEQKRNKIEWDYISRVQSPKIVQHEMFPVDGKSDRKLVYTSLYEWAFQIAKGDETKQDAFDYLERGEMTFNKERNPPAPETIHHLDVKLDEKLFEKLRTKKAT